MSYETPQALRTALEARIRNESAANGISPDRLRRRVVFQRIVTRLQRAEPGRWVLKGGMAMEVRLQDAARLTKDLDLGLRDADIDPAELRDRLIEALVRDDDGDGFRFAVEVAARMAETMAAATRLGASRSTSSSPADGSVQLGSTSPRVPMNLTRPT